MKVYLPKILSWIFGVIFAFIGVISVFSAPMPGLVMLVMAVALLPPVTKLIEQKWKFHLSGAIKIIILVIGFMIFGATINTSKVSAPNKLQPQVEGQQIVNDGKENLTLDNEQNNEPSQQNEEQTQTNQIKTETPTANTGNQEIKYYLVTKVVDGDTIDVDIDGKISRLRLIGIDTPETVDPRKAVQCYGIEASNKAKETLLNKKVKLVSDPSQDDKDKYGRLLRFVYRDDGFFYNKWIIENGYAHEYTYVVPYKFQAEFKQAENYARENKLGLWAPEACNSTTNTTKTTAPSSETTGHIFYTSRYFTSKLYYCDTDSVWEGLSKKYLESYPSEAALLKAFPSKTLHEPCK